MAKLVLIISKTGTGKSSSLRNLGADDVGVVSCTGKELPFKNNFNVVVPKTYADILAVIDKSTRKIIVIDDINYMMSFEEMDRISEIGYGKFTQMARNMFDVFKAIIDKKSDQIFYLMSHAADVEKDTRLRIKTTGKMLDEKIVLEGLTNVILSTDIVDGEFVFNVRTDGSGIKSPIGMFDNPTLPNDLQLVDTAIRGYYEDGTSKNKEKK